MIDFGPQLQVVKQQGRVTLTMEKQMRSYAIWVDEFVAAVPAEVRAHSSFATYCGLVESGDYDLTETGIRRRALTVLCNLSPCVVIQFAYEILSVVTEPK